MAEAVKNNGRKRRPPSHLREGYNQDNFEPSNTQHLGSREPYRQGADPYSTVAMAKLLSKFMNSVNKKYNEAQIQKTEQEVSPPLAKQPIQISKISNKQQRVTKQERQSASSKIQQNLGVRQSGYRQESVKHQQRLPRSSLIPSPSPSSNQIKSFKNQSQVAQLTMKNAFVSGNIPNFESLNKMSRDQYFKMIPKGYDHNLWKEYLLSHSQYQSSKIFGKNPQNFIKPNFDNIKFNQFKQGTKLFKRASFHVGIAYNIHIDTIRQKNPNFGPQELDPTYVSRRLKQQNSQLIKKQNQQNQRLRMKQQAFLRQKHQQVLEAALMRQRQQKLLNQFNHKKQQTPNKKQNSLRHPICIDQEQEYQRLEEQEKQYKSQIPFEKKQQKQKKEKSDKQQEQFNDQQENKKNILNEEQKQNDAPNQKYKAQAQNSEHRMDQTGKQVNQNKMNQQI